METELVNVFIQRQSQLVTDLTNKSLMAESKYQLLEKKYNELLVSHATLTEQNDAMRQQLVDNELLIASLKEMDQVAGDGFVSENEPPPPRTTSSSKHSRSSQ